MNSVSQEDPQGSSPWAMQLVTNFDKSNPPSVTEFCEAVAKATLTLLGDARSVSGEWRERLDCWREDQIRKLVRRASGSRFDRAVAALGGAGGVVTRSGKVNVLACVPTRVAETPEFLSKLQVSGLSLPNDDARFVELTGFGLSVFVNPAPGLDAVPGKLAAQVAHAAQVAFDTADRHLQDQWAAAGFPLQVVFPNQRQFDCLVPDADVVIHDAGFTVVEAGTLTVIGVWQIDLL